MRLKILIPGIQCVGRDNKLFDIAVKDLKYYLAFKWGMDTYDAREFNSAKNIVEVNSALCEACGSCIVACPSGASQQLNFSDTQIKEMVKAILSE